MVNRIKAILTSLFLLLLVSACGTSPKNSANNQNTNDPRNESPFMNLVYQQTEIENIVAACAGMYDMSSKLRKHLLDSALSEDDRFEINKYRGESFQAMVNEYLLIAYLEELENVSEGKALFELREKSLKLYEPDEISLSDQSERYCYDAINSFKVKHPSLTISVENKAMIWLANYMNQ